LNTAWQETMPLLAISKKMPKPLPNIFPVGSSQIEERWRVVLLLSPARPHL